MKHRNKLRSDIYNSGLVTMGKYVIPAGVQIGKNTEISGITVKEDYEQVLLKAAEYSIKAGEDTDESRWNDFSRR